MSWAQALKEFAKQRGQFILPKKDSDDYKAVKAIQEKMAGSAQQKKDAPAVEEPKKKRVKAMPEGVIPKAPVVEAPKETKKKAVNPALACEQLKVTQAAKDQAVEVKVKRARKVKEADPAVDAPKRKPRAKKIEIIKQDVVLEF
jgi:hypothetical protein